MPRTDPPSSSLLHDLRAVFAKAKLPTNPAIAAEILGLTADPEASANQFTEVIKADAAMAARLLRMANSSQFGQRQPVTTIRRAVTVLGLRRVRMDALSFQLAAHLDALEKQLHDSGGPWILGGGFSLADVSWLVIFERLVQADALHVFQGEGRRPQCAAYWARLQDRPSYREAILGHAHPTISYGTQRLRDAKAADPALRLALEGA